MVIDKDRARREALAFRLEVVDKVSALAAAAFGLVAALAWNDAIKAIFDEYFSKDTRITGLVLYALLVTTIAVVATLAIGRMAGRLRGQKDEADADR